MEQAAIHDIFVIGGGINGCGIARDAAGRGYSVYLAEMNDLASGTSSGLDQADPWRPALSRTLRIPAGARIADGARGAVAQRAAHHLADALRAAACQGPAAGLAAPARPLPLRPYRRAQAAAADQDARHAQRSGRQAAEAAVHARPSNIPTAGSTMPGWWCSMPATPPIAAPSIRTRAKVVAARAATASTGPSRSRIRATGARRRRSRRGCSSMPPAPGSTTCCRTRSARTTSTMSGWCRAAISSSRKKFDDPRAYFFQNRDGRIIFAIPYEDDFTLIGTTDRDYHGRPGRSGDQRARDRLSLRRGQRVFRRAGAAARTSSGPIRPCGRSSTTAPRRRRRRRATMC